MQQTDKNGPGLAGKLRLKLLFGNISPLLIFSFRYWSPSVGLFKASYNKLWTFYSLSFWFFTRDIRDHLFFFSIRHLEVKDSHIEFENYHPSFMWGIFHIFDYHRWHNAKKNPLRRKHGRGKYAICCERPKTISFERHADEVQQLLDAEAVPLVVEHPTTKTIPTNRTSAEAHKKTLIDGEITASSTLQRTVSIHHPEPSDHDLGGISTDWANPIIILHKTADTAASRLQFPSLPKIPEEGYLKQNQISAKHECLMEKCDKLVNTSVSENPSDAKQLDREISSHQFKESMDVLEIFKVNKKLFGEILQDPGVQVAKNFNVLQTSNANNRLKKSGTFPAANPQYIRFVRLNTLEHKQKEIWTFPKTEKLSTAAQASNLVGSKPLEDSYDSGGAGMSQETSFPSFASSAHGLNKHSWHQSIMSHFRHIKKKIKHALKEKKKANDHRLMNVSLPSECMSSTEVKETSETLSEITIHRDGIENPGSFHENNGPDNDPSKDGVPHIRRASSLNESLDRYTQLFENSFSREAKWHQYQSKSLKLTNDDRFPSVGHSLKTFRRRLSLPELESLYPIPSEALLDALYSGMPMRTVIDCDTNAQSDGSNDLKSSGIPVDRTQFETPDSVEETELGKNMLERSNGSEDNKYSGGQVVIIGERIARTGKLPENMVEPEDQEHSAQQDHNIVSRMSCGRELEEQISVSVFETHFRDDISGPSELAISQGTDLDSRHICYDEPDSSADLFYRSFRDSLAGHCSIANSENVENTDSAVAKYFEPNKLDDDDFNYVRDVLEISGFIEQEYIGTWHSLDQPLSPILFKELEAYFHQELECSSEKVGCNCDHQLLFDLINKELLEIYESSLAYFPKSFSFIPRVRPLPKGIRVLEEVCKRISWYRNSSSTPDQSLDEIMSQDLAKYDGWLNLQLDVEDVSLDLEDLIFDELLDEVICS